MKHVRKTKRTVALEDGTKVTVRSIRPEDRDALRAAFHTLQPETRYRRFMGHIADLTPAMLTYLTEVDGHDHIALVATLVAPRRARRGAPSELVAVARVIRLRSDPKSAEVAVTVTDALQGRGLGSKLLELLVAAAKERGIERLVAHDLDGNSRMKHLLEKTGPLASTTDGVTVTLAQSGSPTALSRLLAWLRPSRRAA